MLCERPCNPETCCWSRETITSRASSSISPNRTWSHAALYVGPIGDRATSDGEPLVLVEANIGQGVVAAPLSKYARFHTRICRPTQLDDEDRARVCAYAAERIGFDYDLKNIIDLMRYLLPMPVPQRWRRRMIALGSGHPTRIICSALIAQAFETVRYPILPKVTRIDSEAARREILEIRHSSLYAPRDFDISPYFEVVKPTIVRGFDYKAIAWADLPRYRSRPDRRACARGRRQTFAGRVDAGLARGDNRHYVCGMIDAAIKALSQMFAPALRRVLLKSVGLALILIVTIGVGLQRLLGWLGGDWRQLGEHTAGVAPHAAWSCARLGAVDPCQPGHHHRRAVSHAGRHRLCRQLFRRRSRRGGRTGALFTRPSRPALCRSCWPSSKASRPPCWHS